MRTVVKKLIAGILVFAMFISIVPNIFVQVKAEEIVEEIKEEQSIVERDIKEVVNYIYVESPYIETPDTENIVISWNKSVENIKDMQLTVQKDNGTEEEWGLSKHEAGVFLFSKKFTEASQKGSYRAIELTVTTTDGQEVYDLGQLEATVDFGVNEKYEGMELVAPLDLEDVVDVSVVSIDESGVAKAEDDIQSALQTAQSELPAAKSKQRAIAGNVVVALDPGHDKKHAGAQGNGLSEEVLTLKIAKYCKAELETYDGVTVHMTRTTADCPYPEERASGNDIKKRVYNAVDKYGAQLFVSFHLNSSTASSPNGAEIIIQNNSWKPNVASEGKQLAGKIIEELAAVGLKKRPEPIYYKNSEEGRKYEDGSKKDNYSVHVSSKEKGIPGIIIEHAFISNVNDANKYLKTEAGLKKLGVADATGIAKYLGLVKSGLGWKEENGEKYYYVNGQKVKGEYKIGGQWYLFDEVTGVMKTGWHSFSDKKVYYSKDGRMVKGEYKIDGYWYLFDKVTGAMKTGWYKFPDKKVYYNSNGQMVKGEHKISKQWYLFDEITGAMKTGWYKFPDKKVYYNSQGQMVKGEYKISGYWYLFDEVTGTMVTGWHSFSDKKVYYNSQGQMVKGEYKISGYWYLFDEVTGAMITGWHSFPDKKVYYNSNGQMVKGEYKISGYWYLFDEITGAMKTGWYNFPDKRVYYNSKGQMVKGEHQIAKKWYAFDKVTGAMIRNGWFGMNYYGNDGVRVENIDNVFYKIEGKTTTNIQQMVRYYEKYSPIPYPAAELGKGGASNITELAKIFYEEANREGIKAEVVWAQSMLETGYLQFKGDVSIKQFNFAGLGTIEVGTKGADFSKYGKEGVRMGVRAQVQHMKAYVSETITKETLKTKCVDPRFHLVSPKGCAKYVEILGQQENPMGKGWAQGAGYGGKIIDLISKLKKS